MNLIKVISRNYRCVKFVNLSMSSLDVFSDECSTFLDMMNHIGIDKKQQLYIIKKMINIAIRATYYVFCCRNRNWDSPNLTQICFSFLLLFFFNNSISGSICKLPIRSDIYNCTFKNTNKVSIIYIIIESEEPSEQSQQGKENPSPTEGACGTIADEKQGNCTDCSGMHEELSYPNNRNIVSKQ